MIILSHKKQLFQRKQTSIIVVVVVEKIMTQLKTILITAIASFIFCSIAFSLFSSQAFKTQSTAESTSQIEQLEAKVQRMLERQKATTRQNQEKSQLSTSLNKTTTTTTTHITCQLEEEEEELSKLQIDKILAIPDKIHFCNPLEGSCDRYWKVWLLHNPITQVSDPPGCCRPWHPFDMFRVGYGDPQAPEYEGILKLRKAHEMTADIVSYHLERVLGLNATLPMFTLSLSREQYKALLHTVKNLGPNVESRRQRWDTMMEAGMWSGHIFAELQPFYALDTFSEVDGSVCAKFPEEVLHPRVVFNCTKDGRLPVVPPQPDDYLQQFRRGRSQQEKELTCKASRAEITDLLIFDFLGGIIDRKGNCFLRHSDGKILILDNDSGSMDPTREYPVGNGKSYPNLKRIRLRDVVDANLVEPAHCVFRQRTIRYLRTVHAQPGGLGALLRQSLSTDKIFPKLDTLFTQPHRPEINPYQTLNDRVEQLLNFVNNCQQSNILQLITN